MERGEVAITVTGQGFLNLPTLACRFGLANESQPAQFISSEHIQCITPAESEPGKSYLEVTLNGVDYTAQEITHTFLPIASVYRLDPSAGPVSGGTSISLEGSGFDAIGREEGTRVSCRWEMPGIDPREVLVTRAEVSSGSTLTCFSPPADQPGVALVSALANDVSVAGDSGEDGRLGAVAFEYKVRPTTAKLIPTYGWSMGGTRINVTGDGFTNNGGLTCRFHAAPVAHRTSATGDGGGRAVASTAAGVTGVVDVPAKFVSATEVHCLSPALTSMLPQNIGNSSSGVGHTLVEVSNDGGSSSGDFDAYRGLSFWYRLQPKVSEEINKLLLLYETLDSIPKKTHYPTCSQSFGNRTLHINNRS